MTIGLMNTWCFMTQSTAFLLQIVVGLIFRFGQNLISPKMTAKEKCMVKMAND